MKPATKEGHEQQTEQSINTIWEKVKAELSPRGIEITRAQVLAQLEKLEGKELCVRLADKPRDEYQRGSKRHLLYHFLFEGIDILDPQVARLSDGIKPQTRKERREGGQRARSTIIDFLNGSLPRRR
ncbi:MAG: hypothetical protein ACYC6X_02340 [Minisyncoccota bacterium]